MCASDTRSCEPLTITLAIAPLRNRGHAIGRCLAHCSSIAVGASSVTRQRDLERTPTLDGAFPPKRLSPAALDFLRAQTTRFASRLSPAMAEASVRAPKDAPRKSTEFRTVGEAIRFIFTLDFIKLALIGEDRWCAAVVTAVASASQLLTTYTRLLQFQDPRPVPGFFEFMRTRRSHFLRLWEYTRPHLHIIFISTVFIFVQSFLNVANSRVRLAYPLADLILLFRQLHKDFIDWALPAQSYPLVAIFSILMVFVPVVRAVFRTEERCTRLLNVACRRQRSMSRGGVRC